MSVYNSAYGANPDETDMTMINHSFIYRPTDEPIGSSVFTVRRLQHSITNEEKHDLTTSQPSDVIEDILRRYYQDLRGGSKPIVSCDQQLITRIIEILQVPYPFDDHRRNELDNLCTEIVNLLKNRLSEEKISDDQLHEEIPEVQTSIDKSERSLQRMNTVMDNEQWVDFEQETKNLQQIVQTQNQQIQRLIELLLSKDEEKPSSFTNGSYPSRTHDEFPVPFDEIPLNGSIEQHSIPSEPIAPRIHPENEQYICPYCNEQLNQEDEIAYMEHLSQCYNEMNGSF